MRIFRMAAIMLAPAVLASIAAATAATPEAQRAPDAIRSPLAAATALAEWQLSRMDASHLSAATQETRNPRAWEQAVFWIGMTALADAGGPPRIRDAILAMGRANGWRPGAKPYFADDHAITQAYIWAALHGAGPIALAPTRATFDRVVDDPAIVSLAFHVPAAGYSAAECLSRWCWCDALFMAPPAMIALSSATSDPKYRRFALREFLATTDFLYDPAERLYYRDSRFFDRRDGHDRKAFWARGNGWVFASLARILPMVAKDDPARPRLEAIFRHMAARLIELQKPDGYWAPSLLAPEGSPPETSGTAFFTYGMAWGIRAGLLPRQTYEPAVRRGWSALIRAIQPDGRLGYVQQVSDQPDKVSAQDTQYYGTGAFLLAATAVAALDRRP